MTDEKYSFVEDVRDKKSTARSARYKRTHTGKSGRVRLPSDNLTQKEWKAMNGECKSYRLNEPMNWKEFKAMPDDIKITYIKALQSKFNVPSTALAKMFGVCRATVDRFLNEIGIEHRGQGSNKWDREGFLLWMNGVKNAEEAQEAEEVKVTLDDYAEMVEAIEEQAEPVYHTETATPSAGCLTFEGSAENALKTVCGILGRANVRISISWELFNNG